MIAEIVVSMMQDREDDARYGSAAISNRSSFPGAALQVPYEGRRGPPVGVPAAFAPPGPRGLFITGVSQISVSCQPAPLVRPTS